jgi:hypothetical protein
MRNFLIVAAALGAGGIGVMRWMGSDAKSTVTFEHDSKLVMNRLWCDHMPKNERDKMNVFVALTPRPRQPPVGIFEEVSMWEGHFEAFVHETKDEEMRAVFPQSGDKETLTVKASRCTVSGMDYCLEITGNKRGVKQYYSKKGWEVRSADQAEQLAAKLAGK